MSIEDLTAAIKEKVGDKAALPKVIKFDLGDEGVITIDGTGDAPVVSNNDDDADCTISVSAEDFEGILAGDLNPQMAFMMGKLKVDGDMGIAMQLSSVLG